MGSAFVSHRQSFYNSDIKYWADLYLNKLPEDVYYLASSGSSGCSIASAMISRSDRRLTNLYINKKDEFSHGCTFFPLLNKAEISIAIVDDFISSGQTIDWIIKKLELHYFKSENLIILVNFCPREFINHGKYKGINTIISVE